MTAVDDDVTDPLAGIDLNAWQPPAPGAAPVDAILSRAVDATRVDAAPAVEVEAPARARPQRTRWIAIGILIGAAAATMVAWAVTPVREHTRTVVVPGPTPGPEHTPEPSKPAGRVGPALAECQTLVDKEDWDGASKCAAAIGDGGDKTAALAMLEHVRDELLNQLAFEQLQAAVASGELDVAHEQLARITKDSVYLDRAKAAIPAAPKKFDFTGNAPAPCDADKLLDDAREAGASNQWSVMLKKAQASDRCKANKTARQLALLAACKVGKHDVAMKYWSEFQNNPGMQQACTGLVDEAILSGGGDCDAAALLDEARNAGSANMWSKVLSKAEASNKCQPSKIARQLALLGACQLGNRDKALKYWKEFEDNQGMQQRCLGVLK